MKYKLLGRSGLRVSEVCLGTMTFGEAWGWGAGNDECRKIFDAYVSAGGNFIDTANFYTNGESETIVGDLVGAQRDEFVLATKYSLNVRPGDPNGGGNHRKSMRQSIEASLRRLKTDYIDLYWVHVWDYLTPVDEVMRGLDDLVRAGKILYAGISDSPAWVISQANTLADLQGWSPFVGIQLQYNLIERSIEPEFFPMAKQHDLILMAWSPLAGGLLTGKYHTDKETPSDARGQQTGGAALTERKTRIVTKVLEVAKALGRSPSQVALNWTRQNAYGLPVIPILGAKKLSQLKDNLGSLDFSISAEHLSALNAVSSYESAFPHNFLRTKMVDSFLYGGTLDAIDNHRPLTLPVAAPLPTVHIYQSGETGNFRQRLSGGDR
jgi:aryl-alcohol dehydrogenase-like predicted oxidoreductase